ncbi:MAG: type II toxin-antitoxin system VapC family toxin [Thermoguttaceae bacterium]|jgi:tRNA(fMet)-specific endonuclease VapC
MACLDTTILIDLLRSNLQLKRRALDKIEQLSVGGQTIATTRFNLAELYLGIELSDNPQKNYQEINDIFEYLDLVLEFNDFSAQTFGRIASHLRRIGHPAGDFDMLIASTSLAAGHALLVTRNPSHFSGIPDLTVESY